MAEQSINTVIIPAHDVLKRIGLDVGQRCADLGVGRQANFTIAAAEIVGPRGLVYAVDVVKSILSTVESKARLHKVNNIVTVWSDLEVYGAAKAIGDASLDLGMLITVLFQSKQRKAMMEESVRMVKSGGKLLVVDWKKTETTFGPAVEFRPDPAEIKALAAELGLTLQEEFEAGPFHFALVFQK